MAQMITEDLVRLDADLGTDKHDVIRALARIVDDAGRATDADQLAEDALAREATAATGLNGGIAIPHCRSAGVETPTLAFVYDGGQDAIDRVEELLGEIARDGGTPSK